MKYNTHSNKILKIKINLPSNTLEVALLNKSYIEKIDYSQVKFPIL